jgi:mycofactocin precursor
MAESTALAEDRATITEHQDGVAAAGEPAAATPAVAAEPLVADELLVEEVSIDGMCGVY